MYKYLLLRNVWPSGVDDWSNYLTLQERFTLLPLTQTLAASNITMFSPVDLGDLRQSGNTLYVVYDPPVLATLQHEPLFCGSALPHAGGYAFLVSDTTLHGVRVCDRAV